MDEHDTAVHFRRQRPGVTNSGAKKVTFTGQVNIQGGELQRPKGVRNAMVTRLWGVKSIAVGLVRGHVTQNVAEEVESRVFGGRS